MDGRHDSDTDDGVKTTLKSTTEKRFDEMKKCIGKLQAALKNDDWGVVETEWDGLLKTVAKGKQVLDKLVPKFYISFLVDLDNKVNEILLNKELIKNMKPKKVHHFNKMKQHWKKFLKEEKEIEEKMSRFRENPDSFVDEEQVLAKEKKEKDKDKKKKKKKEDLDIFITSSESESAEGSEPNPEATEKENWTREKIEKKIKELLKERGTKGYHTRQVHHHIKWFMLLYSKMDNLSRQLTIKFHIVNSLFDTNQGTSHLNINTWKRIYNELVTILETLFENSQLRLVESREENEEENAVAVENAVYGHLSYSLEKLHDEFIRSLQDIDPQTPEYIQSLTHEKDMFYLLQYATKYYEKKQQDQADVMKSIAALACRQLDCLYYKHEAIGGGIEDVKLQQNEEEAEAEEEPVVRDEKDSDEEPPEEEEKKDEEKHIDIIIPKNLTPVTKLSETVAQLANVVYSHSSDDHNKRKVMLQHVYHLALHDHYSMARDMLLMTHLHEKIHKARTTDQIMFNRALVQLGMAAFRAGKIEDANNCLQDIIQLGKDKAKELLAQGITRYQGEKNIEQEKQERSRQIPYHMHINLDLIEFIVLVCGMLLEIPQIAQTRFKESKKKILSNFRRSYDFYNDRQLFTGPPENTKEAVIVSAKALERGDWKNCKQILSNLEIWKLIPNNQSVLEKISRLIQEQGLRTYLFTYAQYYDTIHISHLATMFELDQNSTHALVSNMMMTSEFQASLDQSSGAIVVESKIISQLQHLALSFAEKANIFLENSEQADQRPSYDRRWNEGQGQTQGQGQGRGQKTYQKGPGGPGGRGGYTRNTDNKNSDNTNMEQRMYKKKNNRGGKGIINK